MHKEFDADDVVFTWQRVNTPGSLVKGNLSDLKDVRIVYAPPAAIGEFGGEVDNWMWPRHTGDFTLLRAYVGADNQRHRPIMLHRARFGSIETCARPGSVAPGGMSSKL